MERAVSGRGDSGEADPSRRRWQGHNSPDLPAHWSLQRRRAFNKRANAIASCSSEAAGLVRDALRRELDRFLERHGYAASDDEVEGFLGATQFEDLFVAIDATGADRQPRPPSVRDRPGDSGPLKLVHTR